MSQRLSGHFPCLAFPPVVVPRLKRVRKKLINELEKVAREVTFPVWLEDSDGFQKRFRQDELTTLTPDVLTGLEVRFVSTTTFTVEETPTPLVDGKAGADSGYWVSFVVGSHFELASLRDQELLNFLIRRVFNSLFQDTEAPLTPQQRVIYRLLQFGLPYKEIAERLDLCHSTVRVQVSGIRKLLGADHVPRLRRRSRKPSVP